jgi:putative membrane protein
MINHFNFKTAFVSASFIAAILFTFPSCQGNQPKTPDSKEVAKEENKNAYSDADKEKDAKFCMDAAEINLTEIELGKLAQNRSMNADVKNLGKMMEDGHTMKLNELRALADKKQIALPAVITKDGQEEVKKLDAKTIKEFDKLYCEMMIDAHKAAIEKFESAADKCVDNDIKIWAKSTLEDLRKHLDQAIVCQDMIKKIKK